MTNNLKIPLPTNKLSFFVKYFCFFICKEMRFFADISHEIRSNKWFPNGYPPFNISKQKCFFAEICHLFGEKLRYFWWFLSTLRNITKMRVSMHKSIREINNCNKKSQKIHNFCHFFVSISRIFQNLNIFGDPENIQKMNHFLTIFGVPKSLDFENIFCPSGRQSVNKQSTLGTFSCNE